MNSMCDYGTCHGFGHGTHPSRMNIVPIHSSTFELFNEAKKLLLFPINALVILPIFLEGVPLVFICCININLKVCPSMVCCQNFNHISLEAKFVV